MAGSSRIRECRNIVASLLGPAYWFFNSLLTFELPERLFAGSRLIH
jgi:hypothetical protein